MFKINKYIHSQADSNIKRWLVSHIFKQTHVYSITWKESLKQLASVLFIPVGNSTLALIIKITGFIREQRAIWCYEKNW